MYHANSWRDMTTTLTNMNTLRLLYIEKSCVITRLVLHVELHLVDRCTDCDAITHVHLSLCRCLGPWLLTLSSCCSLIHHQLHHSVTAHSFCSTPQHNPDFWQHQGLSFFLEYRFLWRELSWQSQSVFWMLYNCRYIMSNSNILSLQYIYVSGGICLRSIKYIIART